MNGTEIPSFSEIHPSFGQRIGQRIARFEQYFNARFRNKFAPVVKKLSPFIPSNAVVFDVGANHGRYAKALAKIHNGSCRVFAFEPLEYNYTLARSVLSSFKNVKLFPVALSNKAGEERLYVPIGKSSKRINHVTPHMGKSGCESYFESNERKQVYWTTIQTNTLDAIVIGENLTRLDFIKVDVEGAESLVFAGGIKSIQKFHPVIYCEVSGQHTRKFGMSQLDSIKILLDLGYCPHVIAENTIKKTQIGHDSSDDFLFLRTD
jgi:FkbM family methyltransferase